jgi:O-antigen ligase
MGSVGAIVMTYSRGGALALAIVVVMLCWRSRTKAILVLVLLVAPPVYLMRGTYFDRLATLTNPNDESSAHSRIVYARTAIKMWQDYPILGVGFGTLNQLALWHQYLHADIAAGPQVVHNTYLQMLTDSGLIACLLHIAVLFGTIRWLGTSITFTRQHEPGLEALPAALQTSLLAFAVGSTFLSRVSLDLYYMILMMSASWYLVERS